MARSLSSCPCWTEEEDTKSRRDHCTRWVGWQRCQAEVPAAVLLSSPFDSWGNQGWLGLSRNKELAHCRAEIRTQGCSKFLPRRMHLGNLPFPTWHQAWRPSSRKVFMVGVGSARDWVGKEGTLGGTQDPWGSVYRGGGDTRPGSLAPTQPCGLCLPLRGIPGLCLKWHPHR